MAKEQTITRTFTSYEVLVLVADTEHGTMKEETFSFDKPMSDKKVIKTLADTMQESNLTPLKVKEKKLVNKKYTITKSNFLTNATLITEE